MTLTEAERYAIFSQIADLEVKIVDLRLRITKDDIRRELPRDKLKEAEAAAESEKTAILATVASIPKP